MAIKTALVNEAGDLDLTGGRASMIEGDACSSQLIRSWLRTFRGEWFMGRKTLGMPYWDDVLVHAPNATMFEAVFAAGILDRPGVRSLDLLELELLTTPARTLRVTYTANTKTGQISRSEVLGG